jgi:hypothetical protein
LIPRIPPSQEIAGQQVFSVTDLRPALERTIGDTHTFERFNVNH